MRIDENTTHEDICRAALSCIVDGSCGIYVPKAFCDGMTAEDAKNAGVSWEDVQICQSGPDHEDYWEAWEDILTNAEIRSEEGHTIRLHQDGDLFEVDETLILEWEASTGDNFWDCM